MFRRLLRALASTRLSPENRRALGYGVQAAGPERWYQPIAEQAFAQRLSAIDQTTFWQPLPLQGPDYLNFQHGNQLPGVAVISDPNPLWWYPPTVPDVSGYQRGNGPGAGIPLSGDATYQAQAAILSAWQALAQRKSQYTQGTGGGGWQVPAHMQS